VGKEDQTPSADLAPRKKASRNPQAKDGTKDGTPKDGASKDGAPKDAMSKDGAAKDGDAKDAAGKDGQGNQGSTGERRGRGSKGASDQPGGGTKAQP